MTLAELRKLISDDRHADQFHSREAYRMSLLVASVEGQTCESPTIARAREIEQQRLIAKALGRRS